MKEGQILKTSFFSDTVFIDERTFYSEITNCISDSLNFDESGISLKIDTSEIIAWQNEFKGYKLYMVNQTDSTLNLVGQDGRLDVIAEVLFQSKWKEIEHLPQSWCGNSYHYEALEKGTYWEFEIPKFNGKIQTKLRYKLLLGDGRIITSNEINTDINKKQFSKKQDHQPRNIMDPYER